MKPKKYILWIEDDAAFNLQRLAVPVVMDLNFDLTLAVTISEAIHFLQRQKFDAVIIDLRMPPGRDRDWIKLYQQLASSGHPPRLGLHLLLNLFNKPTAGYTVKLPSSIITKNGKISNFGILSIDHKSEVAKELNLIEFKDGHYEQKSAGMDTNTLLTIVKKIVANT